MPFFKIIFSKVAYVQAENQEEASIKAMNEDYIFMDETIELVEPSCRSDVQKALNTWGN